MKRIGYKKAQSVLEYVIILTVVVGAILLGVSQLGTSANPGKGLGKLFYNMNTKMSTEAQKVADMVTPGNN